MESKRQSYAGIDVSKHWFDLSLIMVVDGEKQPMQTERFDNSKEGLKQMDKWLQGQNVCFENSLVVLENTGVYHRLIWEHCSQHNLPLHIGNAAQIKWSLGILRGKDDVTDSKRLCNYCYKNREELKASPVLQAVFLQLKDLMTARSRLLSQLNSIEVYLKELKLSNSKEVQKALEQAHKAALEGLKKSLAAIEARLTALVTENDAIATSYHLLLSVPGIGHLTAIFLICCTNNFAGGVSGKQLASYGGMAPFGNKSGTSIKGKDKVHKMANKELKKMMHMCAMAAIQYYPEFRQYYDRKTAEGKHPMSVMNAVKNKIILRAAAVIKKQEKYVDNYKKAA